MNFGVTFVKNTYGRLLLKIKDFAHFSFLLFKIYNKVNWFLVNYFSKLKIYEMVKTTPTFWNSFYEKNCLFVFEKIVIFWIRRLVSSKKFNFSIAAFHTQRSGNYPICLSGQKNFSYHICYENVQNIQATDKCGQKYC